LRHTWHGVGAVLAVLVIWLQGELARGNQPEFVVEPTDMASPGKRLNKGIFVIIKNIG
jgi:hypothetical protein